MDISDSLLEGPVLLLATNTGIELQTANHVYSDSGNNVGLHTCITVLRSGVEIGENPSRPMHNML